MVRTDRGRVVKKMRVNQKEEEEREDLS